MPQINKFPNKPRKPNTKSAIRWRKWKGKILDKPSWRKKEGGAIHPKREICSICKKHKVKYHHNRCNICWEKERVKREKERSEIKWD